MLSLRIYKKKQGQIVRGASFGVLSVLFLYGAYQLYFFLSQWQWAIQHRFWRFTVPLVDIPVVVDPRFLISLGCAVFFVWLFYYLCFQRQRISEFLIDTESEMRKVSWPSFMQVVKSSLAVIFIVMLLGLYLYAVDGFLDIAFSFIF